ncbi:hypothetical protein X777_11653 [Ooceraea biroi]|uniref:Uncharacterized protein n=1 Tax=Ooceraea biroi TaxID=2015173 RepID=A0A026W2F7_OOCBI|nr:hypothetical protein X777_11653 [Ooceraea biroi]
MRNLGTSGLIGPTTPTTDITPDAPSGFTQHGRSCRMSGVETTAARSRLPPFAFVLQEDAFFFHPDASRRRHVESIRLERSRSPRKRQGQIPI